MDDTGELRQRIDGPRAYGHWVEAATGSHGAERRELRGAAEDHSQLVWVQFELQVESGSIGAVRFAVLGCQHTMAAVSRLAESLIGADVSVLMESHARGLQQALGVPPGKLGRLLVIEDALRDCAAQLD